MAYPRRRFERAATPHLEDGEAVLGGTSATTPCGRVVVPAGSLGAPIGADGAVGLPKAFEVVVTDRRLLFFGRRAVTGRPGRLLGGLALTDVAVAELTTRHRGIESAAIVLRNGGSIDVELARVGARALLEDFVSCLNHQLVGQRCSA